MIHRDPKTFYDHRSIELERPVCYLCLETWRGDAGARARALKKKGRRTDIIDEVADAKLSQDLLFKMNDPAFARQLHLGGVTYIRRSGETVTVNTVFTNDASLHGLEFEFYCRPQENLKAFKLWQAEKDAATSEFREPKGQKPDLLPTYLWIADIDTLTDDLIVRHASRNWGGLADWKCDLEIALTHLSMIEYRLVQEYRKGFGEEEIGKMFGFHEHFVRETLKTANRKLRKDMKLYA